MREFPLDFEFELIKHYIVGLCDYRDSIHYRDKTIHE